VWRRVSQNPQEHGAGNPGCGIAALDPTDTIDESVPGINLQNNNVPVIYTTQWLI